MKLSEKIISKYKSLIIVLLTFAVALVTIALVLYRLGIYPFGERLLVYNDMQYQYVDFFMWLHDVLHGKETIGYSFHAGLGGNTSSLFAYYLASPLNLLVYFIDKEDIGQFLTLLIGLKLSLCGSTASYYVRKRYDISPFYAVLLGVSYALMGYNVLQCSNVMWLDGVMILPLIALGLYRMIWEKKRTVYFIALFYGVLTNWYIGFMLCLFAVLYYIFESVRFYLEKQNWNPKKCIKSVFEFGIISLLSVAATSFLFLPQTLHMKNEGRKFDWTIFSPGYQFSFLEGFRDFLLDSEKVTVTQTHPPVYIGTLVLLLVVMLFFSKRIESYKKYLAGIYLLGLMFVFQYKPLNYLFTVLRVPASHAYRYAFLFSFFMIVIAAMYLAEVREVEKSAVKKAVVIIVLAGLFIDYVQPYAIREKTYLSFYIAILMGICLFLWNRRKQYQMIAVGGILSVCLIFEFSQKLELEFEDHQQNAVDYVNYNQQMSSEIERLKSEDADWYRVDKDFTRTVWCGSNESMAYGYSSIAQYTSTGSTEIVSTLNKLGYSGNSTIVPYEPILVTDSLLGVKYIYAKMPVPGCELVKENVLDGVNLYRNPYVLPLGYEIKDMSECLYGDNALENHEILFEKLIGRREQLYTAAEILSEEKQGEELTVWNIKVNRTGELYGYFSGVEPYMRVYANGQHIKYMDWYDKPIVYLGKYQEGDTVQITVKKGENPRTNGYGFYPATLNTDVLEKCIQEIKSNSLQVIEKGNDSVKLEGEFETATDVMLTIPYEDGWKITINGEDISYEKAANAFIGLHVPAGICKIEMVYELPGLKIGILVSILAIIIRTMCGNTRH